jgi:BirA family biotin operon repressor/biotin-[acetyl-CoA-carboxylase] ligase
MNAEPTFRPCVLAVDAVGSTNGEARRLAAAGAANGTVVWARRQTAGRGRRGRTWTSPEGNLYCSLLLRPTCPVSTAPQLCFVTAVAVAHALATILDAGSDVRCKWPNDVIVHGRKVAGILLESATEAEGELAWVIIGIGVNVASHPVSIESAMPASSLHAEGAGNDVTPRAVLDLCLDRLEHWLGIWAGQGFDVVRKEWKARAFGLHDQVLVNLETETLTGVFVDLDTDGALLLRSADGIRRVAAGDVFPVSG